MPSVKQLLILVFCAALVPHHPTSAATPLPYAASANSIKPLSEGDQVPDVDLTMLNGKSTSLKAALAGQPTVLIFLSRRLVSLLHRPSGRHSGNRR
ncbi:MAG: hypothetical protein O3A51_01950 [Verrucomicrobia bacterium]|nr:hypothetical protein [Verrucomicrobiota bacterium]